ncbi:MAG: ammonium transporter [Oscillospiraceae bacterium]|nr:ammonium transporter [Oscillospiraceae bacterium]
MATPLLPSTLTELSKEVKEGIIMTVEFWFLIGAALVFWMQAGFAMVETGFTRAKNAGNIIMKNLMDFCIGTVVFSLLGYSLMMGEDSFFGLIGKPNFSIFTHYGDFIAGRTDGFTDASYFVFNLVFCATTATIVSGAMAERTKFSAYCIYSAVISLVVYPIEAHWIWGGGWLSTLGFHDYAGSCAIHMVGGIAALVGAVLLRPRIGKYVRDAGGKVVKVNAIPGHSIPLGALGVFILWLGWYGFNGAAATSPSELSSIFLTTTIAPSVATCTTMLYTWKKNGKPDVSMCLNASLAGLVAVTAGCDAFDANGAAVVGIVAGILVVVVVEGLDLKLHVDDPVGAVGVHMANGIWGTIAVGLLANPEAPAGLKGLLYTGSFRQLGVQLLGFGTVALYTALFLLLTFKVIEKTNGLRAAPEDELAGLDVSEHGLPSAYADFAPAVDKYAEFGTAHSVSVVSGSVPAAEAVPVVREPKLHADGHKYTKVEIVFKEEKLYALKDAMSRLGITGMTVAHVMGYGTQKGRTEYYRGVAVETDLRPKVQVDIVVSAIPVRDVIETAKKVLYTGHIGDGKIFVYDVENVVKIRTGEEGFDALQDVE